MSWLSFLSDTHVKLATIFTRLEALQQNVVGLAKENQQLALSLAEIKGALANSATPELLRQLDEIRGRASQTDARLARLEFDQPQRPALSIAANRDAHSVTPRPIGPPDS